MGAMTFYIPTSQSDLEVFLKTLPDGETSKYILRAITAFSIDGIDEEIASHKSQIAMWEKRKQHIASITKDTKRELSDEEKSRMLKKLAAEKHGLMVERDKADLAMRNIEKDALARFGIPLNEYIKAQETIKKANSKFRETERRRA